jgi:polygalacturonase
MKKKKYLTLMLAAVAVALGTQAQNPYKKYTDGLPFKMAEVSAPVFPKTEVNLRSYGADGTGRKLSTEAFAKAIDALSAKGGGRLVVPQGVWLTGPIVLKSNVNLHLEAGAVIQFAADETLYPVVKTSFEGLDTPMPVAHLRQRANQHSHHRAGHHRRQRTVLATPQAVEGHRQPLEARDGQRRH